MKSSLLFTSIFSLATTQFITLNPIKAGDDNFDVPCIPFQEIKYVNGKSYVVEESKFSKEIIAECESVNSNSIYAQCNIFDLKINSETRVDDNLDYTSVLLNIPKATAA